MSVDMNRDMNKDEAHHKPHLFAPSRSDFDKGYHAASRAIETEIVYQEQGRGNSQRIDRGELEVGEFILCMEDYLAKARRTWIGPTGRFEALHEIRKVVALGYKCLAHHGAPERD